jgi:hypothetical protein
MASENRYGSYTRTDDIGLALIESLANNPAPDRFRRLFCFIAPIWHWSPKRIPDFFHYLTLTELN